MAGCVARSNFAASISGEAAIAIRIQLGAMPPMLGDVVVQMLGGSDAAAIVGRADNNLDIIADAKQVDANLLVVRAGSGNPAGPIDHIRAAVGLDILEIAEDAHSGTLFHIGEAPVTLDRETLGALALRLRGRA